MENYNAYNYQEYIEKLETEIARLRAIERPNGWIEYNGHPYAPANLVGRLDGQLMRLGIGNGVTHYDGCEEIHLACKVARLQEEIARLREAQRWIPVSERLPEKGKVVLVYDKRGCTYEDCVPFFYDVTHWHLPLSEPPEAD